MTNRFLFLFVILLGALSPIEAKSHKKNPTCKLSSITLLDRNGLSETISSKDRLAKYESIDFLAPQPYQKVMRVYDSEKTEGQQGQITSYHENGQLHQFLETKNHRAFGSYFEWFPNGQLKVQATVISGISDLSAQAEESWLFDGVNWAWDEEGHLLAEIHYEQGILEGYSFYFHPNGTIWKRAPYHQGKLDGLYEVWLSNGDLFQQHSYQDGKKEGVSLQYWSNSSESLAYEETYRQGALLYGSYYNQDGEKIDRIEQGAGYRPVFSKCSIAERHEYRNGYPEGRVELFDEHGQLYSRFTIKDGEKHGVQVGYYPHSQLPHWEVEWDHGTLHGMQRTWYPEGGLENEREVSLNRKNGLLTAWYRDGSLMLLEEYDNDRLTKGEYYRKGETQPISRVELGKGLATLFNGDGLLLKKIRYRDGQPDE